jgi:YVTN family beta-propeller protein
MKHMLSPLLTFLLAAGGLLAHDKNAHGWRITSKLTIIVLVFASVFHLGAQNTPESDPDLTITTIEGPKELNGGLPALGDGPVWFAKGRLFQVDRENNQLSSVPIELEQLKNVGYAHGGLAVGGGSIWRFGKAHNVEGIHRADLGTGKCTATVELKPRKGFNSLTYGEGSLWVLNEHDGNLVRIDPGTNQVSATIELGKGFWQDLKIADGSIWAMGLENGVVKRVDPHSNKVVDEFSAGKEQQNSFFKSPFKGGLYSFSVGEGALWVADRKDTGKYILSRIDPKTHELVATIEMDDSNGAPVFWNSYGWVSSTGYLEAGHFITKINLKTNRVAGRIFLPAWKGGGAYKVFFKVGSEAPVLLVGKDSLWAISTSAGGRGAPLIIHRVQAKQPEVSNEQK